MHQPPIFPSVSSAVQAIDAAFPNSEAVICDGDAEQVSGIIQERRSPATPPAQRTATGLSLYSFRLELRSGESADAPDAVTAIHIGELGRYCGTAEEIERFEASREDSALELE